MPNSIHLIFENTEKIISIDANTAKYLELVFSVRSVKSGNNLFGILNNTKTKIGSRTLRTNILQPLYDIDAIKQKQEVETRFINDRSFFMDVKKIIKNFNGLEELVSFCSQLTRNNLFESTKTTENKIHLILLMKKCLNFAMIMKDILNKTNVALLEYYYQILYSDDKFEKIQEEIDKVFINDSDYQKQSAQNQKLHRFFEIKANLNGLFDVARKTYIESVTEIYQLEEYLCEEYQLPIKHSYNQTRGYFFQIVIGKKIKGNLILDDGLSPFSAASSKLAKRFPKEFLKLSKKNQTIQFTTEKLEKLNRRIGDCSGDLNLICSNIINLLLFKIKDYFDCFYKLKECVSILDMLVSLADYALVDYAMPKFDNYFKFENATHPILKKIKDSFKLKSKFSNISVSDERSITNSLSLGQKNALLVVTGANMSGKSTFLKQAGVLQVMAQCSSYIPASDGVFNLKKQICALSGDSSELNMKSKSSFEQEILEISKILNNLDSNSLFLIDELCRSTNHNEGLAISMAVCEYILARLNSKENGLKNVHVLFTTHFKELEYLDCLYSRVHMNHFESVYEQNKKLKHTFKLKRGSTKLKNYGIKLIELSSFSPIIIEDSIRLVTFFNKSLKCLFKKQEIDLKKQIIFKLVNELESLASITDLPDKDLVEEIELIHREFEDNYSSLIANN